jgi:hypothetical protein
MNKNIQHEFFIWEEKNLTDQDNQNSLKAQKSVEESPIIETKERLNAERLERYYRSKRKE